jgi:hypothetical protein
LGIAVMPRYQIGNNVLSALIKQESGGNPNAVSPKGARGLTQIMPATAKNPGYGVTPLRNNSQEEQLRFTRDYMGALLEKNGGDLNKALAAYNAGQGNVDKYGGIPPFKETQGYVKNIMKMINPVGEAQAAGDDEWEDIDESTASSMSTDSEWEDIEPGAITAQKQPVEEPQGIGERALKNFPGDVKNIGEGVINMAKHPIDTIDAIGGLPLGAVANMLPDSMTQNIPQSDKDNAANLGRSIVGAIQHPLETFANKPASTIVNTAAIASGLTGVVKPTIGKAAKASYLDDVAKTAKENALSAPKKAILEAAQKEGYVVPQSEVAPKFWNNRLEGIAGKAALGQESVLRNQKVVSAQARKAIGVEGPITGQAIDNAIKAQYAPYEEIAKLPAPSITKTHRVLGQLKPVIPKSSKDLLQELKQARHDSQAWYKTAESQGGNPEMVSKAKALNDRAKAIELEFENRALAAGKPELVPELRKARTEIAKIYTVDKARNVATGEIDPVVLGRELDKSPKKISGELKQIGEFQQAFPKFAKTAEMAQTPGVSKIEGVVALGGGVGGGAAGGPLGALIGGGVPLLSSPVRALLLSKAYQSRLADLMTKNPSKVKRFLANATNKTVTKNALMGLIASDKKQQDKR